LKKSIWAAMPFTTDWAADLYARTVSRAELRAWKTATAPTSACLSVELFVSGVCVAGFACDETASVYECSTKESRMRIAWCASDRWRFS
jgi:hypothetical protein